MKNGERINSELFSHFMKINIDIRDIRIVAKAANCSLESAGHSLERGTVVFEKEDLVNNADFYIRQMDLDEEDENDAKEIAAFREMVQTGKPMPDWDAVEFEGKKYFIQYCL